MLSPGVRLLAAPGILLLGALVACGLPGDSARRARGVAWAGVLAAGGLIASLLPDVATGGSVQETLAVLVAGIPLSVRGDSPGLVLALTACAAAALVLSGPLRGASRHGGLLLCLAGTTAVALGGNAVVMFGGLELGNVGTLLMSAAPGGRSGIGRGAWAAFGVQHAGALLLLVAAVELQVGAGTSDPSAISGSELTAGIGVAWALAGMVRVAAAAGLPRHADRDHPTGWLAVAALPSGLAVLLRLDSAASGTLPLAVSALLVSGGLLLALGGAAAALRQTGAPLSAGRWLLTAGAGQICVAVGTGQPAGATSAVLIGLALVAIAVSAAAWCGSGGDARPAASPLLRAAALLAAGGLPLGPLTAGLLAGLGVEVAPGPPRSLVGAAAGLAALLAAVAGATAARDVLRRSPPGARPRARLDVVAALTLGAGFATLPGVLAGAVAERIAPSAGQLSALDSATLRGPGGGWPGGYLLAALAVAGAAWWAVGELVGLRWGRGAPEMAGLDAAAEPSLESEPAGRVPRVRVLLDTVPAQARRLVGAAGRLDAWLVDQPDLGVVLVASAACLAWFGLRR